MKIINNKVFFNKNNLSFEQKGYVFSVKKGITTKSDNIKKENSNKMVFFNEADTIGMASNLGSNKKSDKLKEFLKLYLIDINRIFLFLIAFVSILTSFKYIETRLGYVSLILCMCAVNSYTLNINFLKKIPLALPLVGVWVLLLEILIFQKIVHFYLATIVLMFLLFIEFSEIKINNVNLQYLFILVFGVLIFFFSESVGSTLTLFFVFVCNLISLIVFNADKNFSIRNHFLFAHSLFGIENAVVNKILVPIVQESVLLAKKNPKTAASFFTVGVISVGNNAIRENNLQKLVFKKNTLHDDIDFRYNRMDRGLFTLKDIEVLKNELIETEKKIREEQFRTFLDRKGDSVIASISEYKMTPREFIDFI